MDNEFRFLEFEGIQIAAFIDTKKNEEHPGYHSSNVLFYVKQGQLNVKVGKKLYSISKNNFCLVKKYTELIYYKTYNKNEGSAIVDAMILKDNFIQAAIAELKVKIPKLSKSEPVIHLKNNAILKRLNKSLRTYINENQSPDKKILHLKTKEALLGILKSNPKHLSIFNDFSKPVKANLLEFIKHHYLLNLPLAELAKLSGRSLSTFNRDFRTSYGQSPHKWLLTERLLKAKEILSTTKKRPSEVYLMVGFKDLAHFSKSFKKEFNILPSDLFQKKIR